MESKNPQVVVPQLLCRVHALTVHVGHGVAVQCEQRQKPVDVRPTIGLCKQYLKLADVVSINLNHYSS